jgi:prepilin-type N-terminal cleavage/methylation domain-containing protein
MRSKSIFLPGRFGFTLVELLVVIAIVGLLAGLLIPVTNKALDAGAEATDVANLKQIGSAISAFEAAHNGRWPSQVLYNEMDGSNNRAYGNWAEMVDRMMTPGPGFSSGTAFNFNKRPLWFSKRFAKMPPGQSYKTPAQDPNYYTYYWGLAWGGNGWLYADTTGNFSSYTARIPNRSRLVIVGEVNRNAGVTFEYRTNPVFKRDQGPANYRISRNGAALYLFGDFHVEKIAGDQSSLANPSYETYNATNRLYYRW